MHACSATSGDKGSFVARDTSVIARRSVKRQYSVVRVNIYKGSLDSVQRLVQELFFLKLDVDKNAKEITRMEVELKDAKVSLNEAVAIMLKDPLELEKMIQECPHLVVKIFIEADTLTQFNDDESQSVIDSLVERMCKTEDNRFIISKLICDLIARDVSGSESEASLLRSNTLRTKLYTSFQTEMMRPLMQECIALALETIKKSNVEFVRRNPDPDAGIKHDIPSEIGDIPLICCHTSKLMLDLLGRLRAIPTEMSAIYRAIAESIKVKYPRANINQHVPSFLFLRGINPALISPKRVRMEIALNGQQLKNALAISIAIQDVVNNAPGPKVKWDDELLKSKIAGVPSYADSMQDILKSISSALQQ